MIMTRLKEETRFYHEKLEANPYSTALMQPNVTLADYQTLLELFYGFYLPLEPRLQQSLISPTLDERRKVPLLEQDLRALGCDPTHIPPCKDIPEVHTSAAAWGCLYVLEGATLGGQIISRHLIKQLGAALPLAFFYGYGQQTGEMWRNFRDEIATAATTSDFCDEAIDAATQTFAKLDKWLSTERQVTTFVESGYNFHL